MYIAGAIVKPFQGWKGLELELNNGDDNSPRVAITSQQVEWVNDTATVINTYFTNGTLGGLGVYWGLPLQIYVESQIIFDGYCDLVDDAQFSCVKVITKIREKKTMDWFESIADGRSFDRLARLSYFGPGKITQSDYIHIPYINNDIPDYKQAALFFISSFVIINELVRCIKDIADIVADFSGIFNAGGAAIKLIFYVAYLVTLLIAIYALIKQLIAELIQPVRYHYGMMFKLHWEKMCASLGLGFSSSIYDPSVATNNELPPGLWQNEVHMPRKTKRGYKENESTGQEVGHWEGTFGDFVRDECETYNAKATIINNVMHFERVDFSSANTTYQIPNVLKEVAPKPDFELKRTNAGDIISNYLVEFPTDALDLNTIDRYEGMNCKNEIDSIYEDPTGIELIKGYKAVPLKCTLGRRKNVLTRVEELFKDFLNVIDVIVSPLVIAINAAIVAIGAIIDFINKIIKALNNLPNVSISYINKPNATFQKPNFSEIIEQRIGMLLLTHELTGLPKRILIEGSGWDVKVTQDNETKLSAENLFIKYHYLESFVPTSLRQAGNQRYIDEIPKVKFCLNDYYSIRGITNDTKGEAKVFSPTGLPAKILNLRWNIWKNTAYIKYAEERLFTTNLQQELKINRGQ